MISNFAFRPGAWASSLAWLALAVLPGVARADLQIDITQGVTDPIPIAIVPFARAVPADGGVDVAAIVQRDLESSGRFKPMARTAMLSQPSDSKSLHTNDWKVAGNDYVAIGRVVANGTALSVETELFNALTGQSLGTLKVSTEAATMRGAAHRVSDFIYEKVIGTRGAFATRVAYVSVDGAPPNQRYQLIVADSDGESPKVILASRLPIMSPSWSPDGQWLAYVSFENNASAIYVQQLRTGERRRVSARAGVNSSPAWSPDGKRLALTLSGSAGNLDVYVLDLASQALTRITDDAAIDTEAVWSRDGNQIYFTSDRAGGAQIYKADASASARAQRVTFGSGYAARARLSPDGRQLAFVTLQGTDYRIAVRDENGNVRVLSKGALDESPSFAPNGMTVIYAGRNGSQGVLATVSTDGLVTQRLKSDQGEVREPVWGPFLP
jgi:TolB protein